MEEKQAVAITAEAAQKWIVLQSIIGTHGLSKELEEIAILLLARGRNQGEVLDLVEKIRNSTRARDEALRRVQEAELALQDAKKLLDQEDAILCNSKIHLRRLGLNKETEPAKEVIEILGNDLNDDCWIESHPSK